MFKYTGPTYGPWPLGINGAANSSENALMMPSDISIYFNAVYYPSWRIYKKQPPSSLKLGFVSHVFYAFAWYDPVETLFFFFPLFLQVYKDALICGPRI